MSTVSDYTVRVNFERSQQDYFEANFGDLIMEHQSIAFALKVHLQEKIPYMLGKKDENDRRFDIADLFFGFENNEVLDYLKLRGSSFIE